MPFVEKVFDLENDDYLEIYKYTKLHIYSILSAQILYKQGVNIHITENVSIDWLQIVDIHTFFTWINFKKTQKQKYNTQLYELKLRFLHE